jgi:hypothetical protein
MHVSLIGGGIANWSTPVRAGENLWRANYETFIGTRLAFEDGRQVHVRTRYSGIDDVDASGFVFASIMSFEGLDDQGDMHHGHVDWTITQVDGIVDHRAVYHFEYGTGKWEGVRGSINAVVWAAPDDPKQIMPPTGPIRFWGVIDGEGDLSVPNFM